MVLDLKQDGPEGKRAPAGKGVISAKLHLAGQSPKHIDVRPAKGDHGGMVHIQTMLKARDFTLG